jgi:TonB system transport protein ExbD (group 1)
MAGLLDHSEDELAESHDINVTPFIDVMLVLLIIFMVAAPLATVDMMVDLPASSAPKQPRPDAPLYLTIQKDLTLSVGNATVSRKGLVAALANASEEGTDARIFVRADVALAYGELMKVMNILRDAGYLKIALVGVDGANAP